MRCRVVRDGPRRFFDPLRQIRILRDRVLPDRGRQAVSRRPHTSQQVDGCHDIRTQELQASAGNQQLLLQIIPVLEPPLRVIQQICKSRGRHDGQVGGKKSHGHPGHDPAYRTVRASRLRLSGYPVLQRAVLKAYRVRQLILEGTGGYGTSAGASSRICDSYMGYDRT